jgi:hypothetical protein
MITIAAARTPIAHETERSRDALWAIEDPMDAFCSGGVDEEDDL